MPRRRLAVAMLGPDVTEPGGMPQVQRDLLASPLHLWHDMTQIPTHRWGSAALRLRVFALAVVRLVVFCLRPGPRVVHIHVTVRGSLARKALLVLVARLLRRPVLLHVHAGGPEVLEAAESLPAPARRLLGAAFRRAGRVVSVSTAGAAAFDRVFGTRGSAALPNPAPAPDPPASGDAEAERAGGPVVYLGGFADPVKGGAVLVEALPALRALAPDAEVLLAGPGEPPARAVGDGVRWGGFLGPAAKADALARAAAFVLPSTSGGLPMALLEAMASGAPVVATRVGGVPDVLADGREGVLVEPGDPDALARAVAALLSDRDRARRLADAARARCAELSPERIAARVDALYQELA